MISLLEMLEMVINELPLSEFIKACEKAGVDYKTVLEHIEGD